MPVAPATVREEFVQGPFVQENRPAPAAEDGGATRPRTPFPQRALLAGACVAAFLVGFAAVTMLMWDAGSASKTRPETTPTSTVPAPAGPRAPPASGAARAPSSAPPASMLVGGQRNAAPTMTLPPAPAPNQRGDNAGPPAPSTSAPPVTASPPTTTPTTTAP